MVFGFGLPYTHGATCGIFGVVVHMRGGESITCKVSDPNMELVVMRHEEAAILTVKGVANGKCCSADVTMLWKVIGIYAVFYI